MMMIYNAVERLAEIHVYLGAIRSKSRLYCLGLVYSLPPDEG